MCPSLNLRMVGKTFGKDLVRERPWDSTFLVTNFRDAGIAHPWHYDSPKPGWLRFIFHIYLVINTLNFRKDDQICSITFPAGFSCAVVDCACLEHQHCVPAAPEGKWCFSIILSAKCKPNVTFADVAAVFAA